MRAVWIDYSGLRANGRWLGRRWGVLAACFWLLASVARADDRPGPAAAQEVRQIQRLIGQLDADARSERIKARDALLKLGPAILPLLPEDQTIASAAARQELQGIRLRLERDAALASLTPSRVTLKGQYSLRSVLTQITGQTGNEFDTRNLDDRLLERPITVDFHLRSFWSACDAIVTQLGLAYGSSPGRRLEVVPATHDPEAHPLAVDDEGTFRVAVTSASIRPSAVSRSGYALRVSWSLRAEPRLRPLFAAIGGHDMHAHMADAKLTPPGATQAAIRVLRPISPAAQLELSMNEGQEPLRLGTDFEVPADPAVAPQIDFDGSFAVEMAAGPKQFVFENLAAVDQAPQRAGSVTVRLRHVDFPAKGSPGDARVEISVVYDQRGPAFESYRTWIYHNELWLETKDGRGLRPRPRVATQAQDDGGIAVEYNFANVAGSPADFRAVYVAPTLITQSPMQFQLRNIPTTRAGQQGAHP